jgi:cobalt-zinc-cadmium efflux system outer membrane protein
MSSFKASARAALTLLLPCPPLAFAQPNFSPVSLGLAQAMQLAEQRSQALPAQALMAQASEARAVAAGQRPDPVFRVGLDNVPVEGGTTHVLTREAMTARSFGITQALPGADKLAARSQVFAQQAEVALARRQAQRIELRRATALAWWAVRAETLRLPVLASQKLEADLVVQASEASYRAGMAEQVDVFLARSARVRFDDQTLIAQSRLENARTVLRRWVGVAGNWPLVAVDVATLKQHPLGEVPASQWLARDPDVKAAMAREAVATAMTTVAEQDTSADWSVDVRFSQLGPRYDNKLTLGFSVPIRWDVARRQGREVAARRAEALQAQAETEELRRARQADAERWQQGWQLGLQRLNLLDTESLPLAQARAAAAMAAYRAANGSLNRVLQARQAELALHLERVQLELDTASDWARLDALNSPDEIAQ